MEAVETVFAKRLASGEPLERQRALKLLHEFIADESIKQTGLSEESFARLSKGLHYVLWMQDKMLLQEELADNISGLINVFASEDQIIGFIRAMFSTLSKEWPTIDRWRMDKFLMFIRRIFRVIFAHLSSKDWDTDVVEKYLEFFRTTVISDCDPICESLKYHVAAVYLDELDNAGGLDEKTTLEFIRPYANLLSKDISDTFFRTICAEVFDTILHEFSERLATQKWMHESGEEADENVDEPMKSPGLTFNYTRISELLFEAGKQQQVTSKRRKRIYELCKKFEGVAKHVDPFPQPDEKELAKLSRKRKRVKT